MKILVDEMPVYPDDDCHFSDQEWDCRYSHWKTYCTLGADGVSDCDLKNGECSFLKALEKGADDTISRIDIVKNVIKDRYVDAMHGLFFIRNWIGDNMSTIWDDGKVTIDICYDYEYFEVFGLTEEEQNELSAFYRTLGTQKEGDEE